MADQDDFPAFAREAGHFHVHLGHQRTGGIEYLQSAPDCFLLHGGRDAVRGEDHRGAVRHLVEFLDEHRALGAQAVDHVAVVHHFVPHVDRRAEQRSARSTISMARSTPAQKPRGLASRIRMPLMLAQFRGELPLAAARRPSSQASSSSSPAPTVMAESATLKAGK